MKLREPFFLAAKFLSSRNSDKSIFRHVRGAILGIALSLIPLTVVLQVTDGMIAGITRRYIEIGSYHFQAKNSRQTEYNYKEIISGLEELDFVKNAFTYFQETCLVYTSDGRLGVSVKGLPEEVYENDQMLKEYLVFEEGSFSLDADSILLSSVVAQKINAKVGEEVKIITALTQPGKPMILKPSRFILKGIFTTGYRELDEISVYINYERAQTIFRGDQPTIGIKIDDPYGNLDKTALDIRAELPPGFLVNSWYRINYTLYKSLETTKKLLIFIMILILCVASLNISSAMIMMVMSRKKEIAILKSIGFSRQSIAFTFLSTGFLIGVCGTFIGALIGIFIAINVNTIISWIENLINFFLYAGYYIVSALGGESFSAVGLLNSGYYLEEIPIILNFRELALVCSVSLLLSAIASFFPSYRASAIRPIEIIQKS